MAAAKFTAAAGIMEGIGGSLSGSTGGSGVGGSAANSLRDSRDLVGDDVGTMTIILEGDETTLDHNNPKSIDRFARMMEEVSGRRVVIRRTG